MKIVKKHFSGSNITQTFLVVGKEIVGKTEVLTYSDGEVTFEDVVILPKYRNKGYGKYLIESLIKSLKKKGYHIFMVYPITKRAVSFWKHMGFKEQKNGTEFVRK